MRSGAASSKLETLREAISEIDQRHAEGENGFFADDTSDAPTAATGAASGSVQTSASEEISSFANALSFDDDDGDGPEDFDAAYKKAKKTAMNMLAMRDHASGELRDKLLKRDFLRQRSMNSSPSSRSRVSLMMKSSRTVTYALTESGESSPARPSNVNSTKDCPPESSPTPLKTSTGKTTSPAKSRRRRPPLLADSTMTFVNVASWACSHDAASHPRSVSR